MNQITEIVFILDESGSMHGLEGDTIGGYNSFLSQQKKQEGEAYVTTVVFSDNYHKIHDRVDLKDTKDLTEKDYQPGGCTALLDAVGSTIDELTKHPISTKDEVKTIMVIITDGMENASREYNLRDVKRRIEAQKEKGWEFVFLGANMDAVQAGQEIGIAANRSQTYVSDEKGTALNFGALGKAVSAFRDSLVIDDDWAEEIEEYRKDKN